MRIFKAWLLYWPILGTLSFSETVEPVAVDNCLDVMEIPSVLSNASEAIRRPKVHDVIFAPQIWWRSRKWFSIGTTMMVVVPSDSTDYSSNSEPFGKVHKNSRLSNY